MDFGWLSSLFLSPQKLYSHARKKLHYSFLSNKAQELFKGSHPVYLRIIVDGVPKELSVKRTFDSNRWNKDACRAIGNKEDARSLNEFLDLNQGKSV